MDPNFFAYLQGRGQSFNPYAAGNKQYPQGAPNVGPTDDPSAYDQRDQEARLRRNALLRRMQAGLGGNYMSSAWLRAGQNRSV